MSKGKVGMKSYLVEVSPITSSSATNTLSYFSATKLAAGTLVTVPLRKSSNLAVVLHSRDVRSAKTEIRHAGFLLKKIRQSDIFEASIPVETLEALIETAQYYCVSAGNLLSTLLPKIILNEPETFLKTLPARKKESAQHRETLLLQMESEERYTQYRALVRQAFARGASAMFVVPTHLDIERVR